MRPLELGLLRSTFLALKSFSRILGPSEHFGGGVEREQEQELGPGSVAAAAGVLVQLPRGQLAAAEP